jgi:hypothetical protein
MAIFNSYVSLPEGIIFCGKCVQISLTPRKPFWVQACNEQELNAQTFNGET